MVYGPTGCRYIGHGPPNLAASLPGRTRYARAAAAHQDALQRLAVLVIPQEHKSPRDGPPTIMEANVNREFNLN